MKQTLKTITGYKYAIITNGFHYVVVGGEETTERNEATLFDTREEADKWLEEQNWHPEYAWSIMVDINEMITDHYEQAIATALRAAGIAFIHETVNNGSRLDFYLPDFDIYIEVKAFPCDRTERQIATQDNVILCQGAEAVKMIVALIKQKPLNA